MKLTHYLLPRLAKDRLERAFFQQRWQTGNSCVFSSLRRRSSPAILCGARCRDFPSRLGNEEFSTYPAQADANYNFATLAKLARSGESISARRAAARWLVRFSSVICVML